MRITVLLLFTLFTTALKAQIPGASAFMQDRYMSPSLYSAYPADSSSKKWFLTRYSAISTTYSFFKGGGAMVVAAPIGLQLNRRLNNNLYAFANATVAPAYINFNRAFIGNGLNKGVPNNGLFKSSGMAMYSSASLGLQYVNDERTFSVSGSIGVQRSNYPFLPYYRAHQGQPASTNVINR